MAQNSDPDAPKTLDFPAVEEARQDLVKRYQAMLVKMRSAMAAVLDKAADEVVRPDAPVVRKVGDA